MKIKKDYFLKNYLDNGWAIKKNFFKKKEVIIIKNKVNFFLKKNFKKYEGRDINFLGEKKNFHILTHFINYMILNIFKSYQKKKKFMIWFVLYLIQKN